MTPHVAAAACLARVLLCLTTAAPAGATLSPRETPTGATSQSLSVERQELAEELGQRARSGRLDAQWVLARLGASPFAEREVLLTSLAPVPPIDPDSSADGPSVEAAEAPAIRSALLDCARSQARLSDAPEVVPELRAARAFLALQILRTLGGADDLALAVEITLGAAGTAQDAELTRAFESTARSILERNAKAWDVLHSLADEVPLVLAARLLAAAGDCDSLQAFQALEVFLDRDAGLDAAVLSRVARSCGRYAAAITPAYAQRLRSYLESPDRPVREQAALVVGRLGDEEATEDLIGLLTDEARGARANACWALQQISGLSYDADDPRWQSWYETEITWWVSEAPARLRDLCSSNRAVLVASVHELSRHRLFRRQLVCEVAALMNTADSELVALACSSLGSLGSRSAIPSLVEALARPEDRVRAAAGLALGQITGFQVPAESQAWIDALAADSQAGTEASAHRGPSARELGRETRAPQAPRPGGR